jgi:hypothetical protein
MYVISTMHGHTNIIFPVTNWQANSLTDILEQSPSSTAAVRNLFTFFEIRKFIPGFATVTCPYSEPEQSSPHLPNRFRMIILLLTSRLRLDLPSGLVLSGFPTNFSLLLTCYMSRPSHFSLFYYKNNILRGYSVWNSSFCSFLQSLVTFFPLSPDVLSSKFYKIFSLWLIR